MVSTARRVNGELLGIRDISRPFLNFSFLEEHSKLWPNVGPAIGRIFSQARRENCQTLVLEKLPCSNELYDEVQELKKLYPDYKDGGSWRLSFFVSKLTSAGDISKTDSSDYRGYVIIRTDIIKNKPPISHIFESVFVKYAHLHNFIPNPAKYKTVCCGCEFDVCGVMYCQQNSLNKACAQVAVRSLLSTQLPDGLICYSDINQIAGVTKHSDGLTSKQIRRVLEFHKIRYEDIDYDSLKNDSEKTDLQLRVPYHRFIYAGMESGCGGLVGFKLSGSNGKHIIPFFGHTFNQDTWASIAASVYFKVGPRTRYIPSDEWLSSFIGHDDNFGSNFCIPRKFIEPQQVKYIVSLLPYDIPGSPLMAEALAVDFLYKIYPQIKPDTVWGHRWETHIKKQDTVVRTLLLSKSDYIQHLKSVEDWDRNREKQNIVDNLGRVLPAHFWIVELSLPELFSTNYSKVGELLLTINPTTNEIDFSILRIPGKYSFINKEDSTKSLFIESGIKSHVPLYTHIQGLLNFK